MSVYLDLHAVQSVPAANLNRDDLGSPKTVRYGRENRIRVSSQSWKRVIRLGVEHELGEKAARTRQLPIRLKKALREAGWSEELAEFAWTQAASAVGKEGKALKTETEGHTSVLLFVPESATTELAALCREHQAALEDALPKAGKKGKNGPGQVLPAAEVVRILKSKTASISLFGRMLAELPGANVDGAAQIAHAMTTHASEPQRDYFTAVDDWLGQASDSDGDDEAATGSGHLNTAEFSAGVFYRYASVNVEDLLRNLDGDRKLATTLLAVFAEQFLMSLPQAKKTSTAPHTIPDLAYLAVRERRPISFAAAFETPVRADCDGGYSVHSRTTLASYARQVKRLTAGRGLAFHGHTSVDEDTTDTAKAMDGLGERHASFPGLIDAAVAAAVAERREEAEQR